MESTKDYSTMFYNKDYLSSLNRVDKNLFIKDFVNNVVKIFNNLSLINSDQQPNENIIYHLYSDGTITRQKGGWAYGKRSLSDIAYEIVRPNTYFKFPFVGQNKGDTYSIMTLENCHKVRNLMNELLLYV